MGVQSLWKILESEKESKSLLLFTEEQRGRANAAGVTGANATLKIGVDMGTCMAECNGGALAAGIHNQRAGAGLYIFFKKLTEFIKVPASFVFVLDGPGRPRLKRGHKVQLKPIWWTNLAIALVEAFGYAIYRAPGEAEAELARLSIEGHIHAIITGDSDVYIFGASVILRSVPKSEREYSDEYSLYEVGARSPLTRNGRILFVLLRGGDYDPGVKNCGAEFALGLAKCGFGEQLVTAFRSLEEAEFKEFLIQWRCAIRAELISNSRGRLPRRRPSLAAAIPDDFPNIKVLKLYINPLTSWSPGKTPPNANQWSFPQPSLPAIAQFCRRNFLWKNALKIKEKFGLYLWEGMVLHALYSPSATYNPVGKELQLPGLSRAVEVFDMSYRKRQGQNLLVFGGEPQPRLVVSTAAFNNSMGFRFAQSLSKGQVVVWPRASLLPQALREQLEEKKVQKIQKSRKRNSNNILSAPPLQPLSYLHDDANIPSSSATTGEFMPDHWHIDLTLLDDTRDGLAGEWLQFSPDHWFVDLSDD